jgi:hypothetical protein
MTFPPGHKCSEQHPDLRISGLPQARLRDRPLARKVVLSLLLSIMASARGTCGCAATRRGTDCQRMVFPASTVKRR